MIRRCMILLAALAILSPLAQADDEEGFVSMFNGKDLTGWEGKPGGWWVEDGVIMSQSTKEKPCVKHHYLMYRGAEPRDFVMRLKYRVVGGNSGIQFRSKELDGWDTRGYQADIEAGKQWTGCLFQHVRGGVVMRGHRAIHHADGTSEVVKVADPTELQAKVNAEDWNDYEIISKGSEITLKINGITMAEVDDQSPKFACGAGVIALQMHPGPPLKVQFKDLRIKVLK